MRVPRVGESELTEEEVTLVESLMTPSEPEDESEKEPINDEKQGESIWSLALRGLV